MASNAIMTTPSMPVDPSVSNWTRFVSTFEASEYTNWIDESLSSKRDCFVGDLSPLLKIRVTGPEAKEFMMYITTNSWLGTKAGQTKYAIMCQERGQVIGEGLVLVIGENDFLISGVIHATWINFQLLHGKKKFNATIESQTDDWFIFQVQGPYSPSLMEDVSSISVRNLKYTEALLAKIDGCEVYCLRQGVTGEIGFELWGNINESHRVFDAIMKAGYKHNLSRLGARCKLVNQTEAGFTVPTVDFIPALLGDETELIHYREYINNVAPGLEKMLTRISGSYTVNPQDLQCTPFDLGLSKLIKFDHDFIGRNALEALAESRKRTLVTLLWNNDDVADVYASLLRQHSYEYMEMPKASLGTAVASSVLRDDIVIGFTTSRTYSSYLKKMLSLSIIDEQYAKPGESVTIVWGSAGMPQKIIRAVVEKTPFKPDRRRLQLDINDAQTSHKHQEF